MDRFMESSTRSVKGITIVDVVGQIDLGNSPALTQDTVGFAEKSRSRGHEHDRGQVHR